MAGAGVRTSTANELRSSQADVDRTLFDERDVAEYATTGVDGSTMARPAHPSDVDLGARRGPRAVAPHSPAPGRNTSRCRSLHRAHRHQ